MIRVLFDYRWWTEKAITSLEWEFRKTRENQLPDRWEI